MFAAGEVRRDARELEIVSLMSRLRSGDPEAAKGLVELLYPELRRLAASKMRRERVDHTWQPTVLVNELFCELQRLGPLRHEAASAGDEKAAFLALAAHLMKRLLIHHARPLSRRVQRLPADSFEEILNRSEENLRETQIALDKLETLDPRLRQLVEMKVFEGLTNEEMAARLGCAPRTVARLWNFAREWLQEHL